MKSMVVIADNKLGIARNGRMPWHLPADAKFFKEKTSSRSKIVLMTGKTFRAMRRPLPGRQNIVWTQDKSISGEGVKTISDVDEFLKNNKDIWIVGGSALFNKTLDLTDEIYITRIDHDFACDRFFPEFEDKFVLEHRSEDISENGYNFRFEKWVKKH